MSPIQILQLIFLLLGGIATAMYVYQVVYLLVPLFKRSPREKGPVPPKRYAVIIAARNEEKVIGYLLDSIRNQNYPQEKLAMFVVADNCTDNTAQIAAQHGATVYTRFNKEQVGKGYAVEYLLKNIKKDYGYEQFDAFVVFDADNVLKKDYFTQLNRVASRGYQVFSSYRNSKNFGQSWVSAGHALWYIHDSCHLNHSRMLLGASCVSTGTGYGFTRELLEQMGGWPFHTLTEDIEFSTWCVVNNIKIGFAHNAVFYDEQPVSLKVSWKQRTRWAQGGIQVSVRYMKDYIKGLRQKGWVRWSTFELLTLSLWGYGFASVVSVGSAIVNTVAMGPWALVLALAGAIFGTYFSMLLLGLLTLWTENRKIKATLGQKLMGLFTFPIYTITYAPIAALSLFRKFEWKPIEHQNAVSAESLQDQ